ncbi:MAG: mechanosensitive ion channel, partial [Verrucomicrobia bacterium]|nr:mechanosensitive ion channel [Verrucomicrobiota bacterium]
DGLSRELGLVFGISGVLTVWWFLIRLKQNVTAVLVLKSQTKEICLEPGKVLGLAKLVSVVVTLLMIMLLMEVTGVSINTLIAFGGISGLGIAFASQEIIANFFGGIMVHIIEPFAIGDLIQLPSSSVEGYVEEIGWYETRLRSRDKQPIYIPNSFFSKAYVVNGTRRTHRKIEEKIAIRHQDLPKAPAIITDIRNYLLTNLGIDQQQKLLVNIAAVGPYSIDISIVALSVYVDEAKFLALRDLVLLKAAEIIASHGAEIATPIDLLRPLQTTLMV